tara:strand:- start:2038 stop:2637 length:600 start_codon:yes stop_codon:yes gene_type:complete
MTTTISERRRQRQAERDAERERKRRNTIKYVEVLDAWDAKPLYEGDYNEDGERPILRHDHAWFILVTVGDGRRYFSRESTPFEAYIVRNHDEVTPLSKPETVIEKLLRQGIRKYNRETGKTEDEWSPLFQIGPNHVTNLEGLIAKARMDERAYAVKRAKVLDMDPSVWGLWPYSERGSEAWEAEMQHLAMQERQDPRNW